MDDHTRHGPYDPNLDAEMDRWMDEMQAEQSAYYDEMDRIYARGRQPSYEELSMADLMDE